MSAGRRNRLITIQRPLVTVSATGSTTEAWETYVTLWAEMKDRTTTGVENEHAGSTLSIRRVDWVIRQTAGITSSMRILYDNVVWDILAINSLSYDRNRMQIVTEQRGQITDADLVTCPTMCEQIALADAQDIVDCLSNEQEDAIEAIICPISQDATFTLNSTEVGTAAGGDTLNVQVLQGGNPVGSLVNDDWVVPACEDATYSNGGAFTQAIASGATYTAPQITVTDVDGSTRSSLPNIGVVCEWKTVNVRSSDGVQVTSIASYPAGGNYDVLNLRYFNKNGSTFATIAHRSLIRLTNADFASVVNDSPNSNQANLTIDVDVPLVNSNGDSVGSNITDLFNPAEVDDVNLTDDNGAVGSYPMPTSLVIDGEVDSASYLSGTLTIVPISCPSPSGILYRQIIPSMPDVTRSTRVDDSQGLFFSGYYDRVQNLTPVSIAEIDYTAEQSDVRVTPATGTLSTDNVSPTILKSNNDFGNKFRFTDSLGNASDATVGSNLWAHVDWLNHSFTGAIADYVIDHLTGDGYYIKYLLDGVLYNKDVAFGTGQSWDDWINFISTFTYGGFSDWVIIDASTDRPHYSKCNPCTVWADNFFRTSRATGEIAGQTDNRTSMMTGENAAASLNSYTGINDSSNNDMLLDFLKSATSGFAGRIMNIFVMRKHY
jgi:SPP1 family predicted phage head-tail adaptor